MTAMINDGSVSVYDICIIGGGAAGMTCGIQAAKENKDIKICILEKKEALGRKLLATGNGRCNISNEYCNHKEDVLEFFAGLGVMTRTDDEGRIYPYSQQGAQIVDVLIKALNANRIDVKCGFVVKHTEKIDNGFKIICENGEIVEAVELMIASGGKAGPQYGTTGDGYKWAKTLGHTVTKLAPALTALECEGDFKRLKGIRSRAEVYLFKGMDMVGRDRGEVQFTADGLSGICIFNLSREIQTEPGEKLENALKKYRLSIDFVPDIGEEAFINVLKGKQCDTGVEGWELLETILSTELAKFITENAREKNPHQLAEAAKYWDVNITGVKGWKQAQCTAGGIVMDEINEKTMESKLVPGLYFAGEILDYDGPCGGFNLNNAWYTGMKAGTAMADALLDR